MSGQSHTSEVSSLNSRKTADDASDNYESDILRKYGYKPTLHRTWNAFDSFMSAFGALYFVGAVRILFTEGLYTGGPAALWSSYIFSFVLMLITAACLAEICASLPLSGSIYIWAAEAGGPRWGRLAGTVVAFWTVTAWTSFVSSNNLGVADYMISLVEVFGDKFPGEITTDNIKVRTVEWAVSEVLLVVAVVLNLLSPKAYKYIFAFTGLILFIDFMTSFIWLPIGVSQTYGFQSGKWVFTEVINGTNAPTGWNWLLAFYVTGGLFVGWDAAAHVAEETRNASKVAARSMFWSVFWTGIGGFPLLLLFLFCSPSYDTMNTFTAPQTFVQIYKLALGRGSAVVMTLIAMLGLFMNTVVALLSASRLVFAIARDGVLPGSSWISKVDKNGQPRNAIIFTASVAGFLMIWNIPSSVAFYSLVSCGGIPTITSYALIAFLRMTVTRNKFRHSSWSNGKLAIPFCFIAFVWNAFYAGTNFSPLSFPVTGANFNFACVIFFFITCVALICYFVIPDGKWLSHRRIQHILDTEEANAYHRDNKSTSAEKDDVKEHVSSDDSPLSNESNTTQS